MKLKYIKSIIPATALLVATFGITSCVGDLDVTPIDPSTNMTPDAVGLFNKCYANLAMPGNGGANGDCDISRLDGGTTGFVRQLFNANELTTDESICCWGDEGISAFNFNSWSANLPMLTGFYNRLYFGVSVCNHYLEVVGDYDATMTAEIRFLRALHYYHLMDGWGNVPFTLAVSSEAPEQISRQDLYNWLETELLEIVDDLSEPKAKKSSEAGYGRADKAAAWLLLARLYLNAEVYTGTAQWEKAAQYAKMVMDSDYSLFENGNGTYSAYQMLFMGNNGENGASCEAILPLLQDGVTTTSWGTSLFLIASTFMADMGSCGTTETWAGNRARQDLILKFFPNGDAPNGTTEEMLIAAHDDRALFWGKDRTLSAETPTEFTSGFSVAKFSNVYSDGGTPHNSQFVDMDFFLMRVAEAYLTYAEATARANGGIVTGEGKAAIDAIRSRAHASIRSSYTLDDILDEWSREFYYEGRRRIDLIRYGYFGGNNSYTWQWKGGTITGTTFSSNLNVFAIPSDDLNANSNLVQNPGY